MNMCRKIIIELSALRHRFSSEKPSSVGETMGIMTLSKAPQTLENAAKFGKYMYMRSRVLDKTWLAAVPQRNTTR